MACWAPKDPISMALLAGALKYYKPPTKMYLFCTNHILRPRKTSLSNFSILGGEVVLLVTKENKVNPSSWLAWNL